jgi:Na+/H+ antiporter NhaD/arsenite permease-like protein
VNEYVSLGIFVFVYILIIGRIKFKIPIWVSMMIGAGLMIGFQVISPEAALKAIQWDVIVFIFSMFSIVTALDRAGVLRVIAVKMLSRTKSVNGLLLIFVAGMGLFSAFLEKEAIALMGIPIVVYISKQIGIRPAVLLIALAFGITIGSTMTPIGNPQNLLIAFQSGIAFPFTNFLKFLLVPTVINLFITYYILRVYFRKEIIKISYEKIIHENPSIADRHLAKLSIGILIATIIGFFVSEILKFLNIADINVSFIALGGAAALYALSGKRREIIQNVNYPVLVFFAAMFVVMAAVWSSGIIPTMMQYIPSPHPDDIWKNNAIISMTSVTLSQILNNVPFVTMYHYVMTSNGISGNDVSQWMMLAAASTVAGNLTILAAASNIIIMSAAESRGIKSFTFFEFFKIGIIVTIVNLVVFYFFVSII